MKYRSKKDPAIIAAFDFENEKCRTTTLIYLTGPKPGYSFTITNSTLSKYPVLLLDVKHKKVAIATGISFNYNKKCDNSHFLFFCYSNFYFLSLRCI